MNPQGSPRLSDAVAAAERDAVRALTDTLDRMQALSERSIFIEPVTREAALAELTLQQRRRDAGATLPLFGVPIAVKDNIDVAGFRTTAGCPAYGYEPKRSATVVERMISAGAIVVGKTNLDQFATGLVGVRSPYGLCRSALAPDYIAGGSSSGSALAVAHGIVPLALGTDTAGSGRVPAAFNGLVGIKPTRGLLSTLGVVPACRSLDCVSIFAHSVGDSARLFELLRAYDPLDPFSRAAPAGLVERQTSRRLGVPTQLEFFGNAGYEQAFADSVGRFEALGYVRVAVDLQPFVDVGRLLYGGPWVAERYAAVGEFIERNQDAVHPVVREIILGGKGPAGYEVYRASYALRRAQRELAPVWDAIDLMLLPTTGTIHRVEDVLADPFETNAQLGRYTNFVNLLDLAGIALPAATAPGAPPFGVSLLGPAFSEPELLKAAEEFFP